MVLNWFGHMERTDVGRMTKSVYMSKLQGSGNMVQYEGVYHQEGFSMEGCIETCKDRNTYATLKDIWRYTSD